MRIDTVLKFMLIAAPIAGIVYLIGAGVHAFVSPKKEVPLITPLIIDSTQPARSVLPDPTNGVIRGYSPEPSDPTSEPYLNPQERIANALEKIVARMDKMQPIMERMFINSVIPQKIIKEENDRIEAEIMKQRAVIIESNDGRLTGTGWETKIKASNDHTTKEPATEGSTVKEPTKEPATKEEQK